MKSIKQISLLFALLLCLNGMAQEHARILNHHTTYSIKSSSDIEIKEAYSILVKSKKGYQYAVFRDYFDDFKTIRSVSLTIKDPSSEKKIKKLSKIDGNVIGFNASYEIDDSKLLYIDPNYHNYPFIVEVEVDTKMKGFISLPPWIPRPYFNLAVDKATLDIEIGSGLEVKIKEDNISLQSENTDKSGTNIKRYVVSSLPHVDQNMRYKEFYEQQPKVYISPVSFEVDKVAGSTKTWKDFGEWFLKLNSESYTLTEETKKHIDGLPKDNVRQLVSDIYYYMQSKTRYISIQLGIGGFKSIATEEVEEKGYGDCKALTTYMKNMLDYAGISSNYILVRAGADVPEVMSDFPGNQFNHVFLGVPIPQDTLFLECTSQIVPADYIGTFTDNRNVLWVQKGNSTLIRSRQYTSDDNIQRNFAKIELDKGGNGNISLQMEKQGVFFDEIMMYTYGSEDYIKQKNIEKFSYKDFTIKNFSFNQQDRTSPSFSTNFNLEVKGLGRLVSDKLIIPANLLEPTDAYLDYDKYLGYAEILRGMTIEDSVEVNLSTNYWVTNFPESVDMTTDYGHYQLHFETEGNRLLITRKFRFKKGKYTGKDFEKFAEFLDKVKQQENRKVVLNSKT